MSALNAFAALLIFPCGLFLLANSIVYDWAERKLVARLQNRIGPRWFQTFADMAKLLTKENLVPVNANIRWFELLPVVALASVLTAALYVPLAGFAPSLSFPGDLIVTLYLLSILSLCLAIAGMSTGSNYSAIGAVRLLTQIFASETPFMLALLGPAVIAGSWQTSEIMIQNGSGWMLFAQPIGFIAAVLSAMGKIEMPPFDASDAETEIVSGPLTEYSGRGLVLFLLAKKATLVVSLTLTAALYMGGLSSPLDYLLKTGFLLFVIALLHSLSTRFKIDQTVSLWWRYGILLILAQWFLMIAGGL
jgi:NADH-quinone oxidoreductase subunit H